MQLLWDEENAFCNGKAEKENRTSTRVSHILWADGKPGAYSWGSMAANTARLPALF
jgi:hypothetical protein